MSYYIYSVENDLKNLVLVHCSFERDGIDRNKVMRVINGNYTLDKVKGSTNVVDMTGTLYNFVMKLPFKPIVENGYIDYNSTLSKVEEMLVK